MIQKSLFIDISAIFEKNKYYETNIYSILPDVVYTVFI